MVAGCAKDTEGQPGPPALPPSPGAGATLQQAEANPLSPYPSQPGNLPKVAVGQSIPALSFAALDIAQEMNFFGLPRC